MQKLLRKLESNVEKLEAEIGRLEKEQTAGVTALQTGNVSDFASHQKRLNEVAGLIHRATREWIEAGEALEKVQTELGG
jgi:hypothetical protein